MSPILRPYQIDVTAEFERVDAAFVDGDDVWHAGDDAEPLQDRRFG